MDESLTELTEKQVVNLCDGKILGSITDFKINICTGQLTAMILPSEGGIFGLRRCNNIVIPWEKICRIGKDTIIVDIGIAPAEGEPCKKKKFKL